MFSCFAEVRTANSDACRRSGENAGTPQPSQRAQCALPARCPLFQVITGGYAPEATVCLQVSFFSRQGGGMSVMAMPVVFGVILPFSRIMVYNRFRVFMAFTKREQECQAAPAQNTTTPINRRECRTVSPPDTNVAGAQSGCSTVGEAQASCQKQMFTPGEKAPAKMFPRASLPAATLIVARASSITPSRSE